MYKGEKYIEGFMRDMVRQTVFDQCELIIINANSPENEEPVVRRYMKKYPNIIYRRLDHDPGIYGTWNRAIQMAKGEFITNANVDDRLSPRCYEVHMKALDEHPDVDLVYSDFYVTKKPNETFEHNSAYRVSKRDEFSPKNMWDCLPGCNPMWRKNLHKTCGLFDTSYKIAGDWEMWCRFVKNGVLFLKINDVYALFYSNPSGLSAMSPKHWAERRRITKMYGHLWGRR